MDRFPDEILLSIFRWLGPIGASRLALVNRQFARVAADESIYSCVDFQSASMLTSTRFDAFSRARGHFVRSLSVASCSHLAGSVLVRSITRMKSIHTLNLSQCRLTLKQITSLLNPLPNLKALVLYVDVKLPVGASHVEQIACMNKALSRLQTLTVEVDDREQLAVVVMIIKHTKFLRQLEVVLAEQEKGQPVPLDNPILHEQLVQAALQSIEHLRLAVGWTACKESSLFALQKILQNKSLVSLSLPNFTFCSRCAGLTTRRGPNCVQLSDEIWNSLTMCRQITSLDLSSWSLKDEHCLMLSSLPELMSLDVPNNQISSEGLHAFAVNCPKLKHVNVSGCVDVFHPDFKGLKALSQNCCQLQSLNLNRVRILDRQGMIELLCRFTELRQLALPNCILFSGLFHDKEQFLSKSSVYKSGQTQWQDDNVQVQKSSEDSLQKVALPSSVCRKRSRSQRESSDEIPRGSSSLSPAKRSNLGKGYAVPYEQLTTVLPDATWRGVQPSSTLSDKTCSIISLVNSLPQVRHFSISINQQCNTDDCCKAARSQACASPLSNYLWANLSSLTLYQIKLDDNALLLQMAKGCHNLEQLVLCGYVRQVTTLTGLLKHLNKLKIFRVIATYLGVNELLADALTTSQGLQHVLLSTNSDRLSFDAVLSIVEKCCDLLSLQINTKESLNKCARLEKIIQQRFPARKRLQVSICDRHVQASQSFHIKFYNGHYF